MKREFADKISDFIGFAPIELDSALVSAQSRKRLYWTNIPNVTAPNDTNVFFDKHLYQLGHGYIKDNIKFFRKYPTLVAQSPGSKYRLVLDLEKANEALIKGDILTLRRDTNVSRVISPEECEYLQTLPVNYTAILNKTQRYKCIGNGWTVDMISHILGRMNLDN
jgi:hypothetical protein